jgi:WD40 repeat protein
MIAEMAKNRNCNALDWNPTHSSILLTGYERARGESGLCVWDAEQAMNGGEFKKLNQFGASLAVSSSCWLNSSTALAGIGYRWIRAFDYRDPSSTLLNIVTKAVHGLQKDPFNEHSFISHGEDGVIQLWDARYSLRSMLSIQAEFKNGILDASFSSSTPNWISAVGKETSAVKLWKLEKTVNPNQERRISIVVDEFENGIDGNSLTVGNQDDSYFVATTRRVKPRDSNIHGYAWMKDQKNRMIICSGRDWKVEVCPIVQVKHLGWTPTSILSSAEDDGNVSHYAANSLKMKRTNSGTSGFKSLRQTSDISYVMYKNAVDGYGTQIEKNLQLCNDDDLLYDTWKFIESISNSTFGSLEFNGTNYASLGLLKLVQAMVPSQSPFCLSSEEDRIWVIISLAYLQQFHSGCRINHVWMEIRGEYLFVR